MKKSFIIIGLGTFGVAVAKSLSALKADFIAIDRDEEKVEKISYITQNCAIADATKIEALKELEVQNVDHAIVSIGGNLQDAILTVINLKELGVKKITARISDENFKDVMTRLGATEVIIPEEASAISLANQILSDSILDYYKVNNDYSIATVIVGEKFGEITLMNLGSLKRFDINIIGVTRDAKFIQPKANDKIKPHDILTIFGPDKKITKFDNFLNK